MLEINPDRWSETRLRQARRAVGSAKAEAYVAVSSVIFVRGTARARQSAARAARC
jgi:hypothetical protein